MNLEAWLDLLEQRHPRAIDLGLQRCGTVYRRLGSPRPAKQVYTVAGTNGKGSTVAYLAAMSSGLGQRCGTYTSPHIFRFNERVTIMGEPVSDDRLVHAFEQVEVARGGTSLTYFEFTTLAALSILNHSKLDCAILEVGLGGRLDTVNLVDTDCAVITPIGMDHQDFLGHDLSSIATEKAGIIRPGVGVVCTETNPPGPIVQTADHLEAPLYRRGIEFDLVPGPKPGCLQFSMSGQMMSVPKPVMAGKHQVDNLAAAMAALALINPGCFSNSGDITTAIKTCSVPGRLQQVSSSPGIILDVGHNEAAAQAVAGFLKDSHHSNTTCVLAMLEDKPVEAVVLAMKKVCQRWLCADSPGDRGQTGERLAQRIKAVLPDADVGFHGPMGEAMQAAISKVQDNESVLVFGSFTTVSAAAIWLRNDQRHVGHDAARIT